MYSRKRVGPRMEPSGTPAFTGHWFWFILSDYCDFLDFLLNISKVEEPHIDCDTKFIKANLILSYLWQSKPGCVFPNLLL